MANKLRKCRQCGERKPVDEGVITPLAFFCSIEHAIQFSRAKTQKSWEREQRSRLAASAKVAAQAKRARIKQGKELNRGKHLDQLQRLVNQFVVHVRDKDKPCCTCGESNPAVQYAAGHYRSRGACPETRFILTNIHKQCNVRCNVHGSGMRAEYIEFIRAKYGQEHLDWLDGKHAPLKELLPDSDAIDREMGNYRQMIRDAGLKPIA